MLVSDHGVALSLSLFTTYSPPPYLLIEGIDIEDCQMRVSNGTNQMHWIC